MVERIGLTHFNFAKIGACCNVISIRLGAGKKSRDGPWLSGRDRLRRAT